MSVELRRDRPCDSCHSSDFTDWEPARTRDRRVCQGCHRKQTRPHVPACPCGSDSLGPWRGQQGRRRRSCLACGKVLSEPQPRQPKPTPKERARPSAARIGKAVTSRTGRVTTPNRAADTRAGRQQLRFSAEGALVSTDRKGVCSICWRPIRKGDTCWWSPHTFTLSCTTCTPVAAPAARDGEPDLDKLMAWFTVHCNSPIRVD